MELAYFPGCSLHSMARDYGLSVAAVCRRLGINLKEVPAWSCCGASAAHSRDHAAAISLSARNLALAENAGFTRVATACAGCFNRLKTASRQLGKNEKARQNIARITGFPVSANIEVTHLLQVFSEEGMKRRIAAELKKPLTGIRLAAYYGCMLTRPAAVMAFDDPEQPRAMDDLLRSLGAETVQWPHKAECCGGSLTPTEPGIALELAGDVLESARDSGADAIAVACPMCQANLDLLQERISQSRGTSFNLPVIYFTQLMGLAFGIPPRELGLHLLMTSSAQVLKKVGVT